MLIAMLLTSVAICAFRKNFFILYKPLLAYSTSAKSFFPVGDILEF